MSEASEGREASAGVRLTAVGKRFGERWVFRGLSLALPAGGTTAIVGESGCGKTTLLQLVNGVVRPTEGEVEVFGATVPEKDIETFRRRIGYAVQGAGLFPHMTVRENVTLLARLERWPNETINARFDELLDEMGLDAGLAEHYPLQLSGGQQQRVGLCRALMLRPEMLLLDEPFSAVDPITRESLYEQFLYAREHEGVDTLLVTHDMSEAVRLAGHLVILGPDGVHQSGATEDVLARPDDDYVARLLATRLDTPRPGGS